MKPIAHGHCHDNNLFIDVVYYEKLPEGSNCLFMVWKPSLMDVLRILLGSHIRISQRTTNGNMQQRVDVERGPRWAVEEGWHDR